MYKEIKQDAGFLNIKKEIDQGGKINVYCRFRPLNSKEPASEVVYKLHSCQQLSLRNEMIFSFNHIFNESASQEDVFEQIGRPVLENILRGYNGTILAYGQTSSGKTHTMLGEFDKGLMPRISEQLFKEIMMSSSQIEFKITVSIYEIYNEKIRDLLDLNKNDLKIRENKQGFYLEKITESYVLNESELLRIVMLGQKNRVTCSTNMNEHSSRSHLIYEISLKQYDTVGLSEKRSKLLIVDLAGSEKVSKTGAEGKILEEAKKINLSLTTLGKVIKALAEKDKHICYRDSKLTRIMQDSFGGNSKTSLIVTCSPHEMHLQETITTLRFGESAQKIKNKPKINKQPTIQELERIIEKLEYQLNDCNMQIRYYIDYIINTLKAPLPDFNKQMLKASEIIEVSIEYEKKNIEEEEKKSFEINEEEIDEKEEKIHNFNMLNERYAKEIEHNEFLKEKLQEKENMLKEQIEKYEAFEEEYFLLKNNSEKNEIDKKDLIHKLELKLEEEKKIKKTELNLNYNLEIDLNEVEKHKNVTRSIIGHIFSLLGKEKEANIIQQIQHTKWYKLIVIENTPFSDYWYAEKEEMNKNIEQIVEKNEQLKRITEELTAHHQKESKHLELEKKISHESYSNNLENTQIYEKELLEHKKTKEENGLIINIEEKIDVLYAFCEDLMEQHNKWKIECQLYEQRSKEKEIEINQLRNEFFLMKKELEMCKRDDYYDLITSRKNIVKPLRGGR